MPGWLLLFTPGGDPDSLTLGVRCHICYLTGTEETRGDWAREDKYDAAAFGVFMGSTGFSRFQGGLGEWGEWDEVYPQLGMDFDDDD